MKANTLRIAVLFFFVFSFGVAVNGAEAVISVLGSAKGKTSLGRGRIDAIQAEFTKNGLVGGFLNFVPPNDQEVEVTFIDYTSSDQAPVAGIAHALLVKGYRPATAFEAASLDEVPLLGGKDVTCIGTSLPVKDHNFLTLGFRYATGAEKSDKNNGLQMLFMLTRSDNWKGHIIIPVVKIK